MLSYVPLNVMQNGDRFFVFGENDIKNNQVRLVDLDLANNLISSVCTEGVQIIFGLIVVIYKKSI